MPNRTLTENIDTLDRVRGMLVHFRSTACADRPLVDKTLGELDDVEAIVRDAYPAEEPEDSDPAGDEPEVSELAGDEPAGDELEAAVTPAEDAQ
jgi:hypothetical protein